VKLIVGLGNPGPKYARNRHNVGFLALDAISAAHGFAIWRSKFQGQIAEGRLGAEKVLLLKPETFMNLSGDSVRAALAFHKLTPADLIVLHDEIDLPPGRVRIKTGGGAAGHNGLRSIAAHLGPDFQRVRIGVGHPGDKRLVSNYVLGDFAKDEAGWLDPLLAAMAKAAPDLAAGETARFLAALAPAPEKLAAEKPAAVKPAADGPVAAKPAPGRPAPEPEPRPDDRSPLQRLADRFR
jgi:PTH1 family peptidyl-tRNA hydrolase